MAPCIISFLVYITMLWNKPVLKAHAVKAKIARYYTMQFGNIREIEFTTLYGISLPLPCMQHHSMILRTVYVLVLVSPTTQLQLENCDY